MISIAQKLLNNCYIESQRLKACDIKLIEYSQDDSFYVLPRNLLKNLSKLTNVKLQTVSVDNIDSAFQANEKHVVFIHTHGSNSLRA